MQILDYLPPNLAPTNLYLHSQNCIDTKPILIKHQTKKEPKTH